MIGPTKLCPEGIGLAFFDLDDTILTDGSQVSARVLDTIALTRERGCMACVSTGRALVMVPEVLRQPQYMDYLICANGACIHDTFGGVLYERSMTREQALEVLDELEPFAPGWNAFTEDHAYFEWRCVSYMAMGRREPLDLPDRPATLHTGAGVNLKRLGRTARRGVRYARRVLFSGDTQSQVLRLRPHLEKHEGNVLKLGCSFPSREKCEQGIAILEQRNAYEIARMGGTEIEITAKGATKGAAASWLMRYLDVDPASSVAFGDSENDVPLANVCGTFVAMHDADRRVREMADDICESVYDDGVARWLERAMAEADGARHV